MATKIIMWVQAELEVDGELVGRTFDAEVELELPPGCSVGEAVTGCTRQIEPLSRDWYRAVEEALHGSRG